MFARVEKHMKPGSIISSNTSGLSIKGMTEGRSPEFKKNFLVTHFFNPVRYMKLLELVSGPETSPEVVRAIHQFGEEVLGKGIVYGKDTTNFIANRIGVYGMMRTIVEMQKAELSIEEVDKIFGRTQAKGTTAIPLAVYARGNWIKAEIALAQGKKLYDKREAARRRILDREAEEAVKGAR